MSVLESSPIGKRRRNYTEARHKLEKLGLGDASEKRKSGVDRRKSIRPITLLLRHAGVLRVAIRETQMVDFAAKRFRSIVLEGLENELFVEEEVQSDVVAHVPNDREMLRNKRRSGITSLRMLRDTDAKKDDPLAQTLRTLASLQMKLEDLRNANSKLACDLDQGNLAVEEALENAKITTMKVLGEARQAKKSLIFVAGTILEETAIVEEIAAQEAEVGMVAWHADTTDDANAKHWEATHKTAWAAEKKQAGGLKFLPRAAQAPSAQFGKSEDVRRGSVSPHHRGSLTARRGSVQELARLHRSSLLVAQMEGELEDAITEACDQLEVLDDKMKSDTFAEEVEDMLEILDQGVPEEVLRHALHRPSVTAATASAGKRRVPKQIHRVPQSVGFGAMLQAPPEFPRGPTAVKPKGQVAEFQSKLKSPAPRTRQRKYVGISPRS